MTHTRFLALAVAVWLFGAGFGCSDDDNPTDTAAPIALSAFFNLNVDGQPLILNNLGYTNSSGTAYSIKALQFVISHVTLHYNGGAVEIAELHYYDLSDPSTQSFEFTGLPHEEWTSVSFTFGLDETDNVRDQYLSRPQFHLDMQWPSNLGEDLGYHYMQLTGDYETGPGTTSGYGTHMGPRQMDTDPAPYHFHFAVDLPFAPLHIHNEGEGELTINFNLNDWYTDSDPGDGQDTEYDFSDYPTQAIMGNLEAQGKLQTNGRFCFSAELEAHGGHHE